MNAAAVAKSLGVSRRTLMRWVTQLDLQLDKNELGHYQFSDVDVDRLKQLQDETNQQLSKQEIKTETNNQKDHTKLVNLTSTEETEELNSRKGVVKNSASLDANIIEALNERINELERTTRSKADDVVSYQLLQHRQETEELLKRITTLEARVVELENAQPKREPRKEKALVFDQSEPSETSTSKRSRRKNLISSIFSL
jgi:chromosome-anchoring protein RacA